MINLRASEIILLGILILWSGFMLVGSFDFSQSVARFPRYTSAFVLAGSALLLFRHHAPERVKPLLMDPDADGAAVGDTDGDLAGDGVEDADGDADEDAEGGAADDDPLATDETVLIERPVTITDGTLQRFYLIAMVGGYLVLSYLVGMLWATPVFVALYTRWAKLPLYMTIGLSGLCFALAYVLMSYMYLPIDTGILHDMGVL